LIKYVKNGDLFESGCEMIVNATNCVGIMGGGIALEFKRRFPENYHQYLEWCNSAKHVMGDIFFYYHEPYHLWIANFATKTHWRDPSNYIAIDKGMPVLCDFIRNHYIKSVAIPGLGCGLGGLDWDIVEQQILDEVTKLSEEVNIKIYTPWSN
jgi:O-acetyl-ADP-ribose deacetylase (regulator of RNase III)